MGRYLGIDYGTRRIGLAVGDDETRIASPLSVVDACGDSGRDAAAVLRAASEHDVDAFVVGLPLNMNGTEGPQAALTRRFADALLRVSGRPVHLHDERLTSFAADESMRDAGVPFESRRRVQDKFAAQVMLQAYLDVRRGL